MATADGGRTRKRPVPRSGKAKRMSVIFLGDSLTAAEGVRPEQGYPALLGAALPDVTIHARGRSGWSTASYLRRWPEVASALDALARPTLVAVQLGANDLRVSGHSAATVRDTAGRMATLHERLRAHYGPKPPAVALVAPPMIFPDELSPRLREAGFGPETPRHLLLLRDAYRDLADRRGLRLLDLSGVLKPGQTLDGAHPTPPGHAALAAHLADALRPMLAASAPP